MKITYYRRRSEMKTHWMKTKRRFDWARRFSLIEILMAATLLGLLFTMLLPVLYEAKNKAKFHRWFAFNRMCSNDPDCVVNFNFQQGEGNMLSNSADGCDLEGYSSRYYDGYLYDSSDWNNETIDENMILDPRLTEESSEHNFDWTKGGRWGRYKHALQFNGADTVALIPATTGVDFTPADEFTVMTWLKFDTVGSGDTPFSKSLWGTSEDASAQFDLYTTDYSSDDGNCSFDVDCFVNCVGWQTDDVDFNKSGWTHVALRYKYLPETEKCEILGFVNGEPLGPPSETWAWNPGTCAATDWESASKHHVPLVLGAAGCYREYWGSGFDDDGSLLDTLWFEDWLHFAGRMDEFILYKKALSNQEIRGHWEMGRE